jgi:hypothetical protein
MGKFWEGVGGKLADRWATVAGPALLFWLGGLLAWAHHAGGLHRLSTPTDWLNGRTILTQIAVVLTALLAVLASGMLVDRLTFPALRLLEGYWPGWTTPLRRRLVQHKRDGAAAEDADWQKFAAEVLTRPESATAEQLTVFARLDSRRRRRPSDPNRSCPLRSTTSCAPPKPDPPTGTASMPLSSGPVVLP